jgi:hypothetical protein
MVEETRDLEDQMDMAPAPVVAASTPAVDDTLGSAAGSPGSSPLTGGQRAQGHASPETASIAASADSK